MSKRPGYVREVSPAINRKKRDHPRQGDNRKSPGSYDAWELRCGDCQMETGCADRIAMDRVDGCRIQACGLGRRPFDHDSVTEAGHDRSLRSGSGGRSRTGSSQANASSSMVASCSVPVSSCLTRTVRHEEPALDHRCVVGFLAPDRRMQAGHPCIGACSARAL